ncbi:RES family NAD+ phosphorylase [Ruegeria lacuscaerulensis]|uniref:RES family NAD+ phosphorylase n=1 Tax=Ruegeria lacuscaerulensis TaxID=55218 RepID=UPI00147FA63C|nr:RES family NAD+ phosphorylase [Ruegeria lacuscaerulensis]
MIEFSGPVWRILFRTHSDAPLAPARAPEGRFHYAGQTALYASLSAEGAEVAIRRYVSRDDPPRILQRARITEARLVDFRGQPEASIVWQDIAKACGRSPTWKFSDKARALGADGMIYSSRSRPQLSHVVLFRTSARLICVDAPSETWVPAYS